MAPERARPAGARRAAMRDDLGAEVALTAPPLRVVSLVPSLTEAVAEAHRPLLVGATDWCTHPADLEVTRVRGTKNPDVRAIVELAPDLVIANQEENRELDVRRLRDAGIQVWVTAITTVAQSVASMERLFEVALGVGRPDWLAEVANVWAERAPGGPASGGSAGERGVDPLQSMSRYAPRVAVAIWRDPWMVVGRDTFTGDLLRRAGLVNAYADHEERYPRVEAADLDSAGLDLVLLPDEPYVFTASDGPEAFTATRTVLANGRLLTWYGPSMRHARAELDRIAAAAART